MTPPVPAARIAAAASQLNSIVLAQAAAIGKAAAGSFSAPTSAATIQAQITASVQTATGKSSGDHLAALSMVATAAALAAAKPSAIRAQLAAQTKMKIQEIQAEITKNRINTSDRNLNAFSEYIRG